MSVRKALSKKTRFDVFKRDNFVCQYCGAHPPGVLLHVDHIVAVAEGGTNAIDNLATACAPCNVGKGARSLSVVPVPLAEKAKLIAEREEQLLGYQAIMEAKRMRLEHETSQVIRVLWPGAKTVPMGDFRSVRIFVERLGFHVARDAAEIACASMASHKNLFRYFCGVCWRKLREAGP